jgi:hypothetical protein
LLTLLSQQGSAPPPPPVVVVDTHDYGPDDRKRVKRWQKVAQERQSLRAQLEALLRPQDPAPVDVVEPPPPEVPLVAAKPLPASLLPPLVLPARLPRLRDEAAIAAAERARDEEEIELLLMEVW